MGWRSAWLLVALSACVRSSAITCPDGRVCPEKTVCTETTIEGPLCVDPDQLAQCASQPDGTPCGDGTHRCYDRVCLPGGCGNHRIDSADGELCDDGNHAAGDGCAADCRSDEACGNGLLDGIHGEVCDDGDVYSGDGCSSACDPELMTAIEDFADTTTTIDQAGAAYDTSRDRLVAFWLTSTLESVTLEWDGHGWTNLHPNPSPPPRLGSAMAYDAKRRRVVLLGGRATSGTSLFSDTWVWNGAVWRLVDAAHSPLPRHETVMAYDAKRDLIVLFGGNSEYPTSSALGDTWVFDGTDWQEVTSAGPPARLNAAMTYDPSRGVIVLAGGTGTGSQELSDVWELDASGWHAKASMPVTLSRHALAFDPARRQVLALGGQAANSQTLSSIYAYDGTSWTQLFDLANARRQHKAFTTARGEVIVVGGATLSPAKTYVLERVDANATVELPSAVPVARTEHAMVTMRGTNLMYGGRNMSGSLVIDPTWEHTGFGWIQHTTAQPSPSREGHAMAYDAAHDRVVMFGGTDANHATLLGDTWLWDGTTWTLQTPVSSPSPRYGHSMTYDAKRKQVLLYGGVVATSTVAVTGDTWAWDGTTWTRLATTGPADRAVAAMAYDPIHEEVVLFGGRDPTTMAVPFADTWTWDGTAWTQKVTGVAPLARQAATMVWHAARGRIELFGGSLGTGYARDLWEWDGDGWRLVIGQTLKPAAYAAGISTGTGIELICGDTGGALSNAVQRVQWIGGRPDETCRSTGFDADQDGLVGCADPDCWWLCSPLCPPFTTCDPASPSCGDGTCAATENCRSCPTDCGTCTPVCGDFLCEGEATSCPGDCP